MSRQQAERFIGALGTDPALRQALQEAQIGEDGQPLVAFARLHGFDFTLEELREHRAGHGTELTEEMLGSVAGGSGDPSVDALNNLHLQQLMQRQQKSTSMTSSVLKSESDAAQSIIRKTGG